MPFIFHSPGAGILVRTLDGRNFTIEEAFSFEAFDGRTWVIPPSAQTDGASTPSFIWSVIPPFGKYWAAAVVHDYLYRCTTEPKDYCDLVFLNDMTARGVPPSEKYEIYEAVKLAGAAAFEKDRQP